MPQVDSLHLQLYDAPLAKILQRSCDLPLTAFDVLSRLQDNDEIIVQTGQKLLI